MNERCNVLKNHIKKLTSTCKKIFNYDLFERVIAECTHLDAVKLFGCYIGTELYIERNIITVHIKKKYFSNLCISLILYFIWKLIVKIFVSVILQMESF